MFRVSSVPLTPFFLQGLNFAHRGSTVCGGFQERRGCDVNHERNLLLFPELMFPLCVETGSPSSTSALFDQTPWGYQQWGYRPRDNGGGSVSNSRGLGVQHGGTQCNLQRRAIHLQRCGVRDSERVVPDVTQTMIQSAAWRDGYQTSEATSRQRVVLDTSPLQHSHGALGVPSQPWGRGRENFITANHPVHHQNTSSLAVQQWANLPCRKKISLADRGILFPWQETWKIR
jgi:hypothetical protein